MYSPLILLRSHFGLEGKPLSRLKERVQNNRFEILLQFTQSEMKEGKGKRNYTLSRHYWILY